MVNYINICHVTVHRTGPLDGRSKPRVAAGQNEGSAIKRNSQHKVVRNSTVLKPISSSKILKSVVGYLVLILKISTRKREFSCEIFLFYAPHYHISDRPLLHLGGTKPSGCPYRWTMGHRNHNSSTWCSPNVYNTKTQHCVEADILFQNEFFCYYRPQRSWGKVMFLHVSVILFTGGGGLPQ